MVKSVYKSGLQTLALPSYKNKPQEYVGINVYVATFLDVNKTTDENNIPEQNVILTYSASHLIEHTVAIQNDILFNNLRREGKCQLTNADTSIFRTSYSFNVKAEYLKETLPIILDAIYKLKLNKKIYIAEQDVIDHEYYNNKLKNLSSDDIIKNSEEYKAAISQPQNQDELKKQNNLEKIKHDLMHQNLSPDFLQNYYNKNYKTENSIIAITNCDKEVYKDFQDTLNNYYSATEKKEPIIYDLKSYNKQIDGEFTDEVVNELFDAKYSIYEIKDRFTDRSKYEFFFKFPNVKNTYELVSELYQYIIANPNGISFNEKDLLNALRTKRYLVYTPVSSINSFGSENQSVLYLEVNSSCNNTHKVMTGVRGLINKIAFNNAVTPDDFKYKKEKFKHYFLTTIFYSHQANTIMNNNVLSLFFGEKHFDIAKVIKLIDDIRYEDFVNFAKYVAKTENYSVIAYGNYIEPSDLKAFELKNRSIYNNNHSSKFTGNKTDVNQERKEFLIAKQLQPEPKQKNTKGQEKENQKVNQNEKTCQ